MARKTTIGQLCASINEARRVQYPQRGYIMFADIRGEGQNRKRVYAVINDNGGVCAVHNGATYQKTAQNLREVLSVQGVY